MTRKERKMEREEAFCNDWYMVRKMNKTPTFADAIEWADKTIVEKFLYWLTMKSPFIDNKDMDKAIVELRKYLEE